MKKSTVLFRILTATLIITFFASCVSEAGYLRKRFVCNSSAYALELQRYGHRGSAVDIIDAGEEYMFFAEEEDYGYLGVDFIYDAEDSIVIRFNDGKKIVYTMLRDSVNMYMDSTFMNTKNIYLYKFYEITEIDTDDEKFHIYEERFYITPDDYKNATPN